jgi:formylglycine-generating enzyme required for sulfatase activity
MWLIAFSLFVLLTVGAAAPVKADATNAIDAEPMVLIPEGPFIRGSPDGQGDEDEHPQRTIRLRPFALDRHEVTNRRYQAFLKATKHRVPEHCCDPSYNLWRGTDIAPALLDHPVVNVDWFDAEAFCKWVGKRLPTEAEWEKAARGSEGRLYPWGNGWDRTKVNGVAYWAGQEFNSQEEAKVWWGEGGVEIIEKRGTQGMLTLPVTALEQGATPTGLMHMAGNVWEWVADWYDPKYYTAAPEQNPQGPENGEYKVLRGGSWLNQHHLLRATARDGSRSTMRNHGTGFRCAKDA